MRSRHYGGALLLAGAFLALAGCGSRKAVTPPAPAPAPPVPQRPQPPGGAAPTLVLPDRTADGRFRTVNTDLSPSEAVWHLRSALNVAALACGADGIITARYNALLRDKKTVLASAYRDEAERHSALDRHVTGVYNFFAQPPAQSEFCKAARSIADEAAAVPAARFEAFAPGALARLDAPFQSFYAAYADYRTALARWEGGDRSVATAAAAPAARIVMAAPVEQPSRPWLIQLGAYSGRDAAEQAWGKVRARMKGVDGFSPRYEDAFVKGLVRLRIGPVRARDEAVRLCAAAAASNLDCFPVAQN